MKLKSATIQEEYRRMFPVFSQVTESFAEIFPGFGTQGAQSMTELYLLVIAHKPKTIFELGTGYRASTLALSMGAHKLNTETSMFSLDLKHRNFQETVSKLKVHSDLSYIEVKDITMNALDFEIPDDWERPILTFYDAHDTEKTKIFEHAIKNWFPRIKGQIVAVHDCSVLEKELKNLSSDHYIMRHFNGLYVAGFGEIRSMIEWMNRKRVNFSKPTNELGGGGGSPPLFISECLNEAEIGKRPKL